jgi:catechol 2,3-dioxygenase-like lactoylglutathione lyase family enzyme
MTPPSNLGQTSLGHANNAAANTGISNIGVRRIGHATFETPDLARMIDYYVDVLGLTLVAKDSGAAYLACPGDYHSVVLRQGNAAATCRTVSLQLAPDADIAALEAHLRAHGLHPTRHSDAQPNVPVLLSVTDPAGLELNIFRAHEPVARDRTPQGVIPRKLGHTAFFVPDPQASTAWYETMLGFRVSDWIGDFFVFLRCGPDHHTMNFLRGPAQKMHHIAFELNDWHHVKDTCDLLDRHDLPLSWGPGRHGPGSNIYTYHTNPDGITVELFCELDVMSDESLGYFDARPWHKDHPQRPKVWTPGTPTTNFWGIPRPDAIHRQP